MAELGLITDREGGDQVWTDAVELADVHGLTLYDSMYLELALRTGLPLATLDKRLARAALETGVLHS
jgi:predicted nucleic acid-binding protein